MFATKGDKQRVGDQDRRAYLLEALEELAEHHILSDASSVPPPSSMELIESLTANAATSPDNGEMGRFFTEGDVAFYLADRAIREWVFNAPEDPFERWRRIRILDPTCGAGAFLVAALQVIRDIGIEYRFYDRLLSDDQPEHRCLRQLVMGVDIDLVAVRTTDTVLRLACRTLSPGGELIPELQVTQGCAKTQGALPDCDVVLANPPFVTTSNSESPNDLITKGCGNLAAQVLERALSALSVDGAVGMVMPLSLVCSDRMQPARRLLEQRFSRATISSFDAVPATLFKGVEQRIALFVGMSVNEGEKDWKTTTLNRWRSSEREGLLDRLQFVPISRRTLNGAWAKIGSEIEAEILERLSEFCPAENYISPLRVTDEMLAADFDSSGAVFYKRRWSYHLLFTDFVPGVWDSENRLRLPSELRAFTVANPQRPEGLLALYSSSLFYWFFSVYADNRNLNWREISAMPIGSMSQDSSLKLSALSAQLMRSLRESSSVRTCNYRAVGQIKNTYLAQASTLPIVDLIDEVLADHFGFTEEMLTFIKEFQRRWRR